MAGEEGAARAWSSLHTRRRCFCGRCAAPHIPSHGKVPCLSYWPYARRERSFGAPACRWQGPALTLSFAGSACAGAQAFARLSAVYGGTYMLNKPDAEVVWEDGAAVGVRSEGQTARAKLVVRGPPPPPLARPRALKQELAQAWAAGVSLGRPGRWCAAPCASLELWEHGPARAGCEVINKFPMIRRMAIKICQTLCFPFVRGCQAALRRAHSVASGKKLRACLPLT